MTTAASHSSTRVGRPQFADQRGFVERRAGAVTWVIQNDLADSLLSAQGLRFFDGRQSELVQTVKTGPHRTVYRVTCAAGEFYLKHFRIADWKALVQNIFRPCKAELERRAARHISALGLPTFEPVASGRIIRQGIVRDSFLISRAIPEALPLDQYLLTEFRALEPARAAVVRQHLARELGRIAARLHMGGVLHVDLHAGNLLVHVATGSLPRLWLIDLHAVRFHPALSTPIRLRNLAALHQFFAGKTTRSDRRRFYDAYEQERYARKVPTPDDDFSGRLSAAEIQSLEQRLVQSARAGWNRADRAWRRGNRHVRKLDTAGCQCRGLAVLDADMFRSLRDAPDLLFSERLVRWLKRSGRHRAAVVSIPLAGGELAAFCKSIAPPGIFGRLVSTFRESAVRRAWETGHALIRRGIDTPRPLLFIDKGSRAGGDSFLLTDVIPQSQSLSTFLLTAWPELNLDQRRWWFARHSRRLAAQLRLMHDCRFDHRDLKLANLLVSSSLDDDRTWLVDLDGVRRWGRLPAARIVQNLSRLEVSARFAQTFSRTDRLRFLRQYLGVQSAWDWKRWWRKIAARSATKIASNLRRGRRLS